MNVGDFLNGVSLGVVLSGLAMAAALYALRNWLARRENVVTMVRSFMGGLRRSGHRRLLLRDEEGSLRSVTLEVVEEALVTIGERESETTPAEARLQ